MNSLRLTLNFIVLKEGKNFFILLIPQVFLRIHPLVSLPFLKERLVLGNLEVLNWKLFHSLGSPMLYIHLDLVLQNMPDGLKQVSLSLTKLIESLLKQVVAVE